ncbi:EFB1 (YAL003W) [Zygosaccharomyces parabailii]|uniref:BN860_08020g1_1 n=1 Tax=Zygosaccharomyces bailii (strain CLIB 213 / ATCC 58445 / CBS 680 / BCRC 21525 / NBRC 1098 / NCYC 1416 / NRRL Y-2227) TaxID=1333698 RepID=A0A8J2T143_ZYGB2|nr:EFB1 (YAL003W) [Zygosaccharomyces parabailii]CDF87510.1 BN860_08020g1_1 [Zygosaccharomyces bailii CLIB 213]CDH09344.1 probable Elongation factor 1-beta [Zygosaccharomyces bailii ISA1307]
MSFTNFSNIETLQKLNTFLADKSYIEGATASQADATTYRAFQKVYPDFTRWFNHIASKADEFESLPASQSAPADEDDDEVDLFGSDDEEEDAEAAKIKAQRVAEYQEKKSKKPAKGAAKSIVTLDVKPWDDETNMEELLANVLAIEQEGLKWGAHKLVPQGYGINKLQINLVVEDEKVSLDELQETIEADEDHVQSTDIAAMQKL